MSPVYPQASDANNLTRRRPIFTAALWLRLLPAARTRNEHPYLATGLPVATNL